ncbi:hypothetical protein OHB41_03600 [Streptomyces sp. NBC_01571]|uniref:hypothetical protein n=1 Tax=Streptomyces sp. NBC_01571 TaxID=2975883 RepID=UPI00224FD4E3|nr:hypothetical protein [Streptomyces sp. NBC_01571]MCX4572283.1 hypothetical protein [Streptomyces sp. NBC_01571]
MALVPVEIVNGSSQTVRLSLEEDGDTLAYFRKLARREDLESVTVLTPAPARKSAAK